MKERPIHRMRRRQREAAARAQLESIAEIHRRFVNARIYAPLAAMPIAMVIIIVALAIWG